MSVPNSFSPNTRIKSADVNANFNYLTETTKIKVFSDAGIALPNSSWTTIVYEDEEFDTLGEYDHTTGVFQPSVDDGYYFIDHKVLIDDYAWTAGQSASLAVFKNGIIYERTRRWECQDPETMFLQLAGGCFIQADSDDEITVKCIQNSGGERSTQAVTEVNALGIFRII